MHMPAVMLSDESDARDASHSQSTVCEMQLKRHYVLSRARGTFGVRTRTRVAFAFSHHIKQPPPFYERQRSPSSLLIQAILYILFYVSSHDALSEINSRRFAGTDFHFVFRNTGGERVDVPA